jgi:hypothetical protein
MLNGFYRIGRGSCVFGKVVPGVDEWSVTGLRRKGRLENNKRKKLISVVSVFHTALNPEKVQIKE